MKNKRIYMWNDTYIDKEKSTVELVMHEPVKREAVFYHDEPWEDCTAIYHNIFYDNGKYRMYYLTRKKSKGKYVVDGPIIPGIICYAESDDGIRWKKPDLRLFSIQCDYFFGPIQDNNIVMDDSYDLLDNFFVFKDRNPNVPKSERYKGIGVSYRNSIDGKDVKLWCHISEDGIHFKKGWIISAEGTFDSLNVIVWNNDKKKYYCYFRGVHKGEDGKDWRDIRYMTSDDFRKWSKPERVEFLNSDIDFQMYTNGIFNMVDNEDFFVGLATRYNERDKWTSNYDELCGKEKRIDEMKMSEPRSGLAITDCVLISSYDGKYFYRFDEAFLRPSIEKKDNWVYGDCYPGIGIIKTHANESDAPDEWSFYMPEGHISKKPAPLYRYTIRQDGFASVHSKYKRSTLLTTPFIYDGGELFINFSTSAVGYIYISITDKDGIELKEYSSGELFGDNINRHVTFEKSIEELKNKDIRLKFVMSDADLYSFIFK